MSYEFYREAEEEFSEAVHWYEDQSEGLGSDFAAAVLAAIHAILRDPERYQVVGDGSHVFRMNRWPYKIFYECEPASEQVWIVSVMHQKRRPGSWTDRVRPRG